jgi:hypothetical protein
MGTDIGGAYTFACLTTNTWTPFYRGMATVLPPTSVTWVNQNSCTYTSNAYAVVKCPQWSGAVRVGELVTTVPATPYKYYARISWQAYVTNYYNHGFCLYESATSKSLCIGISSSQSTF